MTVLPPVRSSLEQESEFEMSHFLVSMGAGNLILHIQIVINWHLLKQGIGWPVSQDRIAGSSVDPSSLHASAYKFLLFNWS